MTKRRFQSYSRIGKRIVNSWGWNSDCSDDERIRNMSHNDQMTCLLAAIVDTLDDNTSLLDRIDTKLRRPKEQKEKENCPVSMGVKEWASRHTGQIRIRDTRYMVELSSRARATINRLLRSDDCTYVSDLTQQRLEETRGCGAKTTEEILKWAAGLKNPDETQ